MTIFLSAFLLFQVQPLLAKVILLLSATAPLLQSQYGRVEASSSPYRLYALSNAGSLLALLSYPFLVEPFVAVRVQLLTWPLGFGALALLLLHGVSR